MKRIWKACISVLLSISMSLSASTVFAVTTADEDTDKPTSGTCGENVTWSYDAEKKELTLSGSGATESYDKTEDRPFNGLSYQIYSIVIEPGVTSLGKNLFNYVANLKSVTFPDTLTEIGERAFYWCGQIKSLDLPSSVTTIGEQAFHYCESLETVTIPASVTSLGAEAFGLNEEMYYAVIENPTLELSAEASPFHDYFGMITIVGYAGSTAEKYAKETGLNFVKIGDPLPEKPAPEYCGKNVKWSIDGDTITLSGTGATYNYNIRGMANVESVIKPREIKKAVVEPGITVLGGGIFSQMTGLETISIPDTVTEFAGDGTFNNCKSLVMDIPPQITKMENSTFFDCTSLTEITIPEGMKFIGYSCFYGCENLTKVTFLDRETYIQAYSDSTLYSKDHVVIWGHDGSTAEAYAAKYGFRFGSLERPDEEPAIVTTTTTTTTATAMTHTPGTAVTAKTVGTTVSTTTATAATSVTGGEPRVSYDINHDGGVDLKDGVLLCRFLTEDQDAEIINGDLNGDGVVTVLDARLLLKWILVLSEQQAVPVPVEVP